MVARTPTKLQQQNFIPKKMVAPLDPILLRQTLQKVDKCMERLQELQYTVTGGNKMVSGITLSPRSTRGYLRTSLRCKQESLRIKNGNSRRSPTGKLPTSIGDWRRMSLPAMLLGETVGEILQASQFAKEIAEVVAPKKTNTIKNQQLFVDNDPKTPLPKKRIPPQRRPSPEKNSELRVRRKKEKQMANQTSTTPSLQRAKSRINFKVFSPPLQKGEDFESSRHYMAANRVSPRHRPWSKKTVLFPNPLFHSSPTLKQHMFCRTKSPVITKKHPTPHKFLIKSPVKIRSPPLSTSPTRAGLGKSSPKMSTAARIQRSFSPSRLANPMSITRSRAAPKMSTAARIKRSFSPSRLANPTLSISPSRAAPKMSTAARIKRSFSPSRFVNRMVSPLKSRKSLQKIDGGMMKSADGMMSGLKQRPDSTSMRCTAPRM